MVYMHGPENFLVPPLYDEVIDGDDTGA